jgi:hypothetical protein
MAGKNTKGPTGSGRRVAKSNEEREIEAISRSWLALKKNLLDDVSPAFRQVIRDGEGFGDLLGKLRQKIEDFVLETAVVNPLLNGLFGTERANLQNGFGDSGPFSGAALGGSGSSGGGLFGSLVSGLFDVFSPSGGSGTSANSSMIFNITTPDVAGFRASQHQIAAEMAAAARRSSRIR